MRIDLASSGSFVIGSKQVLRYQRAMNSEQSPLDKPKPTSKEALSLFLRAFLVPTLVTKALIVYFGLQYVEYPDEGYGYGLAISIVLMLVNFGIFLYQSSKYHFD